MATDAPLLIETPEEIFNAFLAERGHGRTLQIKRKVEEPNVMEHLRRLAELLLAELPEPRPHFFFVQNEKVNAIAVERRGLSFIGVWETLAYVLWDTFNRMLAMPDLFPKIGDASREKDHGFRQKPPNNLKDLDYREQGEQIIRPIDPVRAEYADLLTDVAFGFVVVHEAAHIYHGHLGYTTSLGATGSMLEIDELPGPTLGPLSWRARQMLEYDADAEATRVTFKKAVLRWREGQASSEPWPPGPFSTQRDAIETWVTAIYTGFHVLYGTVPGPFQLETRTHLPAHVRLFWVLTTAYEGADLWFKGNLEEDALSIVLDVAVRLEKAYARISGEIPDAKGILEAVELSKQITVEPYLDEWARMYPELLRFARVPLVKPNPDALARIGKTHGV